MQKVIKFDALWDIAIVTGTVFSFTGLIGLLKVSDFLLSGGIPGNLQLFVLIFFLGILLTVMPCLLGRKKEFTGIHTVRKILITIGALLFMVSLNCFFQGIGAFSGGTIRDDLLENSGFIAFLSGVTVMLCAKYAFSRNENHVSISYILTIIIIELFAYLGLIYLFMPESRAYFWVQVRAYGGMLLLLYISGLILTQLEFIDESPKRSSYYGLLCLITGILYFVLTVINNLGYYPYLAMALLIRPENIVFAIPDITIIVAIPVIAMTGCIGIYSARRKVYFYLLIISAVICLTAIILLILWKRPLDWGIIIEIFAFILLAASSFFAYSIFKKPREE